MGERLKAVTEAEVGCIITNRLLWEILEEIRRPNREEGLRRSLYAITDAADADSVVERLALDALAGVS